MIDEASIEEKVKNLKAQREQAIDTVKMIDGALQILGVILDEAKQPPAVEATTKPGEVKEATK